MVQPYAELRPGAGGPWMRPRHFPRWQGAFHRRSRPQLASGGEDDQVGFHMVRSGVAEVVGREPRWEPRARTTFRESGRTWTTVGNASEVTD